MRKIILVTIFAILAPAVLILDIFLYSYLKFQKENSNKAITTTKTIFYAAIPKDPNIIIDEAREIDFRIEKVQNFFSRYKSPLAPYSKAIIDASDRYELDYRLLPAIAMQESNLCKKSPPDWFNCWGFGVYGKKVQKFENFDQAIDVISKTLARDYKGKGLISAQEIASKYTPSDTGKWVNAVNYFMEKL